MDFGYFDCAMAYLRALSLCHPAMLTPGVDRPGCELDRPVLYHTFAELYSVLCRAWVWERLLLFFMFASISAASQSTPYFENVGDCGPAMEILEHRKKKGQFKSPLRGDADRCLMPCGLRIQPVCQESQPMGAGTAITRIWKIFWYLTTFCRLADWSLSCFVRRKRTGA
ncbi:MAG: hypothetical protein ACLU70_06590 [Lachnospira sp.]